MASNLISPFFGGPGARQRGHDLAPVFRLEIGDVGSKGIPIGDDVSQFIQSVEFESSLGMADLARVVIDNPGVVSAGDPSLSIYPDWVAHKAWQPGNQVNIYMGYGSASSADNFVGSAIWMKHLPFFPRDGMPQLEVKGYDLSAKMADASGPITSGSKRTKLKRSQPIDSLDNQGTVFRNSLHSEVVEFIADMYGVDRDIDSTSKRESVVLKKGSKHYEIIQGLANLNNREFWVDYNIRRNRWVLHWKKIQRGQRPEFVFRYGAGDGSTLLEAEPEYGLRETVNQATILVFDQENQRWVSAVEIDEATGPDPIFRQGGGIQSTPRSIPKKTRTKSEKTTKSAARAFAARRNARNIIGEALENASAFRIAAGGVAIDVLPPGRRFRDPEEAARWLLRWFLSKRDNFVSVQGIVIGVEKLKANQVHTLAGLGERLDGDYYFTRVRHIMSNGYWCEFHANKVIKS